MELPQALHPAFAAGAAGRIRAERRAVAFILLRDGAGAQRIVELEGDVARLTIGREPTSDVALDWDGEASRLHAELECIEGQWTRRRRRPLAQRDVPQRRPHRRAAQAPRRRRRAGRPHADAVHGRRPATSRAGPSRRTTEPAPQITDAQRRVLVAVCRPFAGSAYAAPASTRQVADELFISVDTVKTHLRALFEAFGVEQRPQNQKRAELVRRAFELGVVAPSDFQ